ncbi:hypothetical protein [Streptomyces californicus]|uniref:hypothetical protein n=1 Tax=Streptomyces californicus TaxID=67351 RepID=UPI00296EFE13|nr:hypothetical protein [Streptomyces californicus]MDW4912591.1 hypothetical protein [Streptomyces californicus]
MTFTWAVPPWLRHEDCTHMAATITALGGELAVHTESVRGNDASEALADLLMGPGGGGGTVLRPHVVAVVVRRGIDLTWMFEPPIRLAVSEGKQLEVLVAADQTEVTVFSAEDVRELAAKLHLVYGPTP